MVHEKNAARKSLWIGLRCRNKDCNNDFLVQGDDGGLVTEISMDASVEEAANTANAMLGRLSPILDAISALHGAKAFTSGTVNISSSLQHCPYCGRWYLYPYSDYFLTVEDMPELPE